MCNQLKVEFFKLRHCAIFFLAAACMAGLGFSYGYIKLTSVGFSVYRAFQETNCDTSFMFLPALVSAWFVGADFSSRTIHHEITLGYSRWSILAVRELPVYLAAAALHYIYVVSTMLGVGSRRGFSGGSFSLQDFFWCGTVLLQLIALQSIIVFISVICAKAPAAIAGSVCFAFITCNILRNFFDGKIFTSSCFCLARNNDYDTLLPAGVAAVLTCAAMVLLTYGAFRRKEIK